MSRRQLFFLGLVLTAMGSDGNVTSGHLASFDRKKCTGKLNGPQATGNQCPESWTLHAESAGEVNL